MSFPDWKNKGDYDFVTFETIKAAGVAWEFLRRNQKYQEDYQHLIDQTVTDHEENPPLTVDQGILLYAPEQGFFDPPLKPGESQNAWLNRCLSAELPPRILSPSHYLAKKWKVGTFYDPQKNALELDPEFIVPQHPRIITKFDDLDELEIVINPTEDRKDNGPTLLSPNNILVVFSLKEKITPQWKRIQKKLLKLQRDYSKSEGHKTTLSPKGTAWIPALRAWDSTLFAPELSKSQRVEILYGDNNSANNNKFNSHFKTATRLITSDYLEIARKSW